MTPLATTAYPTQKQHLDFLLNTYCHEVPHVAYAIAASGDGLALAASDHLSDELRDKLAATACGLLSLGFATGRMLDTVLDEIILEFRDGWLVIQSIFDRVFLLAFTGPDADLGQVHHELIRLGESIGQLLDPGARASA